MPASLPTTPTRWTLLVMTAGACVAMVGVYTYFAVPPLTNDFGVFYREGRAWVAGEPLYAGHGRPNLNSPLATLVLFGSLARLPYGLAQVAWLAAGGVATVLAIRVIQSELQLSDRRVAELTGLLFLTQGALMAIRSGQVTWLLLYPFTLAWAAHRRGRPTIAGIWLGAAIALKPSLAPCAALLPLATLTSTALTSLGLSAASVPVTGWEPWVAWIRQSESVTWLASPANASLWGVAARLEWRTGPAPGLTALSLPAVIIVLAVAAALALESTRRRGADSRFLCGVLWALLVSPLGWAYYLPLAAAPAAALWRDSWGIRVSYGLTLLPVAFDLRMLNALPVSVFFLAVLTAWFFWTRVGENPPPSRDRGAR